VALWTEEGVLLTLTVLTKSDILAIIDVYDITSPLGSSWSLLFLPYPTVLSLMSNSDETGMYYTVQYGTRHVSTGTTLRSTQHAAQCPLPGSHEAYTAQSRPCRYT